MGCWNSTCLLSGLSIKEGDRVILFPFTDHGNSLCMIPFRGTYDDYGCIENIDADPLHDLFLAEVNAMCIPYSDQKNYLKKTPEEVANLKRIDELSKKSTNNTDTEEEKREYLKLVVSRHKKIVLTRNSPEPFTVQSLLNEIERGYVSYYAQYEDKFKPISFAMIREDVWDKMSAILDEPNEIREQYGMYFNPITDLISDKATNIYNDINERFDGVEDVSDAEEDTANATEILLKWKVRTANTKLYGSSVNDFTHIFHLSNAIIRDPVLFPAYMVSYAEKYALTILTAYMRITIEEDPKKGSQVENHRLMKRAYEIFQESVSIRDEQY